MKPDAGLRARLPIEQRVLAALLKESKPDGRLTDVDAQPVDPGKVVKFAAEQDVLPLLAYRLEALGLLESAPWCSHRIELRTAMAVARAEAAWRQHCAAHVIRALRPSGVRVVPLKGLWLAERHYQRPFCRRMADIDLLVVGEPRVILESLASQGILAKRADPAVVDYVCSEGDQLSVYAPWAGATAVDLHFRLHPDLPLAAAREVSERALPARCAGVEVHAPALPDHLLLVTHHLVLSMERPLWRAWVDVDRMAREIEDWDAVIERSLAWGNPAMLLLGLAGARQLFDTPIADDTWARLAGALRSAERHVVCQALADGAWHVDRDALLVSQWHERRVGWRQRSLPQLLWPHPGFVACRLKQPSASPGFWLRRLGFAVGRLARVARIRRLRDYARCIGTS